jgi:hypothetical protein
MTKGEAKHLHEFQCGDSYSYISLKMATAWESCIKTRTNKISFGHLRNLSLSNVLVVCHPTEHPIIRGRSTRFIIQS